MSKAIQKAEAVAPAVMDSEPLLSLIERAAKDPSVDLDKMQRLFEMHERVESRRAEQAYNASMAAAQQELQPVARTAVNTHTKSKYAALDAVYEACKPVISKHGFGTSFSTAKSELPAHIKMVCDVTHTAGFSKRYESDVPVDGAGLKGNSNKTDIQAFGSTTTYARRYMTLMIFDIATTDDTDGNAKNSTITDEQQELLKSIVASMDENPGPFLEYAKVDCFADIKAKDFGRLHAILLKKQKQVKK